MDLQTCLYLTLHYITLHYIAYIHTSQIPSNSKVGSHGKKFPRTKFLDSFLLKWNYTYSSKDLGDGPRCALFLNSFVFAVVLIYLLHFHPHTEQQKHNSYICVSAHIPDSKAFSSCWFFCFYVIYLVECSLSPVSENSIPELQRIICC